MRTLALRARDHHQVNAAITASATAASNNQPRRSRTGATAEARGSGVSPAVAGARGTSPDPTGASSAGETCNCSGGSMAVRATPCTASHHSMRGPGRDNAPGFNGTIAMRRRRVVRGRPSMNCSSACTGSANTCAWSVSANPGTGTWLARAPSAIASSSTIVASPTRASRGDCR